MTAGKTLSLGLLIGASLTSTAARAQPLPAPPPVAAQPLPPQPPPAQPPPAAQPPVMAQPLPPLPPPGYSPPPPPAPYPAVEPPRDELPIPDGVTRKGVPFSQRGGIIVDVAGLHVSTSSVPFAAIDVSARIPVADRTFLVATLPFGFGALGNPMAGVTHVFRPDERFWINLGGAVGAPLIRSSAFEQFSIARAMWDTQEFTRDTMPFAIRLGLEAHLGLFELRAEADPVFGPPVSDNVGALFALQHAVEAQVGHSIGGGIRYQGVLFGTKSNPLREDDHYQGAFEAFFRLYHDPIFARLGLFFPLNAELGEVNGSRTWGVRASTGFNID